MRTCTYLLPNDVMYFIVRRFAFTSTAERRRLFVKVKMAKFDDVCRAFHGNKIQSKDGCSLGDSELAASNTASFPKHREEEVSKKMNPSQKEIQGPRKRMAKDAVAKQQLLEQHRGSREMREIIVETVTFTGSEFDRRNPENPEKADVKDQDNSLSTVEGIQDAPSMPADPNPDDPRKLKAEPKAEPKTQVEGNSTKDLSGGKPAGHKNKKSKKMPSNVDAAKRASMPESSFQSRDGQKDSSSERSGQKTQREEELKSDIPLSDPTSATRSYASAVSGSPLAEMVETKDEHGVLPADSSVSVGGSAQDGKHASKSPLSKHQNVIPFFSGNPSVEITKGILHLFKENEMTPLDEGVTRSEMLCMLAVPATMTCHDLLQLAAPLSQGIQLMRVIRDTTPNQYMVLIKFKQQKDADEFYSEFNGKPFNSIESSICYLVYVSRVECMKASEGATLPVPGLTELPTCHICLERMDESVDGILTILCNHSFHGNCLDKWGDTSCPVCRYCQTPEAVEDHKCFTCGAQESLWICLICGHVGCGRYSNRHSYTHFEETQHTYAMQLGNQRVWDYAGDNYVHRLVQSKGDGKPIEWDRQDTETAHTEKLDSLQLEYSYLLTSQLESQRIYFEEQMARIEQDALNRMSEVEARSRKTVEERDKMEQCLQTAVKEKTGLERKCSQLSSRLSKITAELKEEKEMNRCLRDNQQLWQTKVMELEKKCNEDSKQKQGEIDDLKEQLRDLMFYLDAQQKIGSTSEDTRQEIQDGQIVIGAAAASSSTSSRKGRKKGR
ncbi:BRCA1-associated protein-like isoform X2 [Acanthaster planci]|uniref:BRCA1-associated protein-like isoform X2 n=1 Tax=Acanthaster planci TaxID=133434 RepID=A0A8B7ZTT2_ACAPL|nr:BRCA1-associated protein-like isoform X2 [Acanthaster planci]